MSELRGFLAVAALTASVLVGGLVGSPAGTAQAQDTVEGRVVADRTGRISVQLTGERSVRVEEMPVDVGDRVRKGDVIARLNSERLKADRLVAVRNLEEAQANVGVEKADVAIAELRLDRAASLKNSPSFNRAAFEDAEVALQAAQSELKSAESVARLREAEVAQIDLEIGFAEIIAPYDGVVVEMLANVGAAVTQRNPDLMTLVDLSKVEIEVPADRGVAAGLTPGQSVAVSVAGGDRVPGTVRAVLPANAKSGVGRLVRIAPASGRLPAGTQNGQPAKVFIGG